MPPKQTKKTKTVINHAFRGQREAFLVPAPRSGVGNQLYNVVTDASGAVNFAQVICPVGLSGVVLSTGNFIGAGQGNITGPPLRRLYNTALDFQWFRITRARFIFVGSVASTAVGHITLAAYTDPVDVGAVTYEAYVSSPSTRTFDLSNAATKELSVTVPVDSAWKKVSTVLTAPANVYPFTAANAAGFVVVNTVSDLCAGAVSILVAGGPATTNIGTLHLEYDVEFKGPIDPGVNA